MSDAFRTFPMVKYREIRPGDVWSGNGNSWNTALPPADRPDDVCLLLMRGGEWTTRTETP